MLHAAPTQHKLLQRSVLIASNRLTALRTFRQTAGHFGLAVAMPRNAAVQGMGSKLNGALAQPTSPRGSAVVTRAQSTDSSQYDYDLFTIGAGSGGVRGSRMASSYGARVAVCELPFDFVSSETKGGIGGTCVLRGCVPKKLMVYASEYADEFRNSSGFGWQSSGTPDFDLSKFMDAKRKELQRLNNAYKTTLSNAKVTVIEGRGKVVDPHTVEVEGKRYTAKNIMIAVGGRAQKLKIPGAEHCLTSDEILELEKCPKKITIVGGGYIAMEFGGIFQRFGSDVHIIYRQDRPLRGFDEEVRKFVDEQYAVTGLKLHPGTEPTEIKKQADGRLTVVYKHKDGKIEESADNDEVLMATGRTPNTATLGLKEIGVKLGKKGDVIVDEYSRSSVPSIWAVGDVTDRIALTPVALMEGTAVAKTVVLDQPTKPDYWAVASAVFSYPSLATVGYTEEQAVEKFPNVDIFTTSFKPMRNQLSGSQLRSFYKILVDADTDRVIGMHIVGDEPAEIIQGFAVAIKMGVTKTQLDSTVGVHPSAAEELVTMRTVTRKVRRDEKK